MLTPRSALQKFLSSPIYTITLQEALVSILTCEPFLPKPSSLVICQEYFFIKSLVLCANLVEVGHVLFSRFLLQSLTFVIKDGSNQSEETCQAKIEEVEGHLAILKLLSDQFAPNYISKYQIVAGDLALIRGNIQVQSTI